MTNQIQDNSLPSLISPEVKPQDIQLNKPVKLGVMASGSGTNFAAIAEAIKIGQLNAQLQVLIYNNPEAKVKSKADHWGVPAVELNHRQFKHREDLDCAIVENLQKYQVEWVVMAGWMRIVTRVLIDAFPDKIINIHPSLLPSFRGNKAVKEALDAGVKITGCTVHLVRLEVDSGPIIAQAAVPILPNDTLETLHARIQIQEHKIFPQAIALAVKATGNRGKSHDN